MSIGDTLTEARKKKGQSLKDVEKETKIRAKYLEALEQNKFDLIPGDAYVKIFIREYAHFLNIDPDPLVSEYKEKYESAPQYEKLTPVNVGTPKKPYRKVFFGFFIIMLFLAGGFFIWRTGLLKSQAEKALVTKKVKPVETKPKRESHQEVVPEKKQSENVSLPPPPPSPKLTVKVTAVGQEESWIKAEVDGQTVFEDAISAGQVKEWSAQNTIVLNIGNPTAVQVEKNGVLDSEISKARKPITKAFTP